MSGPCRAAALAIVVCATPCLAGAGEDYWPSWRGPEGTGVARGSAPTTWSDGENVKWAVPIPGRGFSTPIVWGDRIFLTTAVPLEESEEAEKPEPGQGRLGGWPRVPRVQNAFLVMCLDRRSGGVLWERTARETKPHEGYHFNYGSHASISPVTDGERLYASFGSRGLYAYDLDGKLLWSKDLGVQMRMRNEFGEGSAPVVHGDTLVQVFDHEGDSFIVALDARTGEERWRAGRDEPSCWSTPLILEHDGVLQVVTTGTHRVRSYALASGELLWECGGLGLNAIPNPVLMDDILLVMTGYRDANLMAIRLGGEGDLTGTDAVLWSTTRATPYTASPVLHDGLLYAVMDRGFISCWDAASGEALYVQQRLPRGSTLKASPVAADGKLYVATESGDVHVIALGTEYELVATNTLEGQFFVASPAIADGELFLRSRDTLFCISEVQGD